ISRPLTTYGLHPDARIRAVNVLADGPAMRFQVVQRDSDAAPLDVVLNMPGEHNVRNALAAIAIGLELGVAPAAICSALESFTGVGRRFARLDGLPVPAEQGGGEFTVIDDYGHHPVEMSAT